MRRLTTAGGAAILALLLVAAAPARDAAPAPAAGALDRLSFMTGCWEAEHEGDRLEECWLAPAGDLMLGVYREILAGGPVSFDFLRVESTQAGIVLYLSENGALAVPFDLAPGTGDTALFVNPRNVGLRRIFYWIDPNGRLRSRFEGSARGRPRIEERTWRRSR